jgi:hypothetical protein
MERKLYRAALLALVVALVVDMAGAAAAEKSEGPKRLATGVEDQSAVALTIYNVNLGLVKDQRQTTLSLKHIRYVEQAWTCTTASVILQYQDLQLEVYEYHLLCEYHLALLL